MTDPDTSTGLVSVVIPAYNRSELAVRAVACALAQTVPSIEVIVVDDGGSDHVGELLHDRFGDDRRVRVIRQENAGPNVARNRALREVTGEFVAFLDTDDLWRPWKLELQLAVLNALPEVGMVWTDTRSVDGDGKIVSERHNRVGFARTYEAVDVDGALPATRPLRSFAPGLAAPLGDAIARWGMLYPTIIAGNVVTTSTVVLRRAWADALAGFDEDLRVAGGDFDYHLRTARLGPVAFLEIPSADYRFGTADQLTRPEFFAIQAANYLRTVDKAVAQHPPDMPMPRKIIRGARGHAYLWLAIEHGEAGHRGTALRYVARSLACDPGGRLPWRVAAKVMLPEPVTRAVRAAIHVGPTRADSSRPG